MKKHNVHCTECELDFTVSCTTNLEPVVCCFCGEDIVLDFEVDYDPDYDEDQDFEEE